MPNLTIKQKSFQNADDVEKRSQHIEGLTDMLKKSQEGGRLNKAIIDRIDRLAM
jgi:hypothetical protein